MKDPMISVSRPRVLVLIIIAGILLAALVATGIYGLLRGPTQPTSGQQNPSDSLSTADSLVQPPRDDDLPRRVLETTDPELFARYVSEALFVWDSTEAEPADYAQPLIEVGDPTGAETAGLAADVRSYLPTPEAWAQLRTYQTQQWITIDTVEVPESWAIAEAQATEDQLPEGSTAYTVTGTRHRSGIWGDEPIETSREVSFTVFLACEPAFETCHLLRLSGVDNPLE